MFNKLNALILTIVDFVLSEAIDTKRGPRVFIFFRSSCLELRANDSSSLSVGFRPITSEHYIFSQLLRASFSFSIISILTYRHFLGGNFLCQGNSVYGLSPSVIHFPPSLFEMSTAPLELTCRYDGMRSRKKWKQIDGLPFPERFPGNIKKHLIAATK